MMEVYRAADPEVESIALVFDEGDAGIYVLRPGEIQLTEVQELDRDGWVLLSEMPRA